jgi:hypothetical protein
MRRAALRLKSVSIPTVGLRLEWPHMGGEHFGYCFVRSCRCRHSGPRAWVLFRLGK